MDQEDQNKPQNPLSSPAQETCSAVGSAKPFLCPLLSPVCSGWLWGFSAGTSLPTPTYEQYSSRGWMLSPHFLIDIWTRWDSKWYLSIAENGYTPAADLSSTISNVAFFPLYPYLIKFFNLLLPGFCVHAALLF